jgi:predicted lactoylglutathione lyase
MGYYYRTRLAGEALNVAVEMLTASKTFIADLSTWINTTYQDTLARMMSLEKEAWALISHCV